MSKHFNFLILLTLLACTETSNKIPVFEANINGNLNWNAETFVAIVQNNGIAISGSDNASSISLIINNLDVGNFDVYSWTDDYAIFQDTIQYSTRNDGVGSVAFLSDGEIDILEIDSLNNTITGNFHFDAYDSSENTINVSEGVFYKIPMTITTQD